MVYFLDVAYGYFLEKKKYFALDKCVMHLPTIAMHFEISFKKTKEAILFFWTSKSASILLLFWTNIAIHIAINSFSIQKKNMV